MNVHARTTTRLLAGLLIAGLALAGLGTGLPGATAVSPSRLVADVESDPPPAVVLVGSQLELRRAVAAANRRPGVDRIGLTRSVGLAKGNGKGPGALRLDLDVTDDLVLNGAGFSINGRGLDRVLDVAEGVRLELNNLTVRGGSPAVAGQSGGLLRVTGGQVRLGRATLSGGRATGSASASGGAVANDGGRVVLVGSTVTGNTATGYGGGIASDGGTTVVRSSTLQDNQVTGRTGGAMNVAGVGTATVADSVVSGNQARGKGGGLAFSRGSRVVVRTSRVEDNVVDGTGRRGGGGGVYVGPTAGGGGDGGLVTVVDSVLADNFASARGPSFGSGGGGLLNESATVEIRQSTISGNTALADGGGVSAIGGSTTLVGTDLLDNLARKTDRGAPLGFGGGIALSGGGTASLSGGTVGDNSGDFGGGVYNSGSMTVTGTAVTGNVSGESRSGAGGGGVFNVGTLAISDASLTGNRAAGFENRGGAVLNNVEGDLRIERSTLERNAATDAGGGIATTDGTVTLVEVDLLANSTTSMFGDGGSIHLAGTGALTYDGGTVTRSSAGREGGGLWNSPSGRMTLTGVGVTDSTAPISPQAHQSGETAGAFTIDGQVVPTGDNRTAYPNP